MKRLSYRRSKDGELKDESDGLMCAPSICCSGHLHQHRDRTFDGQRYLWVSAVAFAAPHAHGGDGRCGLTVLDFSQASVQVTIERPRGLISHDLAAIKGHGRYEFLRDMPPSPPPYAG